MINVYLADDEHMLRTALVSLLDLEETITVAVSYTHLTLPTILRV